MTENTVVHIPPLQPRHAPAAAHARPRIVIDKVRHGIKLRRVGIQPRRRVERKTIRLLGRNLVKGRLGRRAGRRVDGALERQSRRVLAAVGRVDGDVGRRGHDDVERRGLVVVFAGDRQGQRRVQQARVRKLPRVGRAVELQDVPHERHAEVDSGRHPVLDVVCLGAGGDPGHLVQVLVL